ncbi:MAG: chemotaxis protein CheW [Myxococcales bacterium]
MAEQGGQSGTLALLVCRVGTRLCGIPLEHVRETMRPLPTEPLANLPDFVSGLALIRGRPTPVLDAHHLLGGELEAPAPRRYVTIGLGERRVALAVDAVLGVRHVEQARLAELPPVLRESGHDSVSALGTLDRELLLLLERSRLLPDSVWQTLEAEAPAP